MKISQILGGVFALGLAMPGFSQTTDHSQHGDHASKAKNSAKTEAKEVCTPEHAAMGHCKLDEEKPVEATAPSKSTTPSTDPSCPPEHAAMGHCTPKKPAASTSKPKESGATKPSDKASTPKDPACLPEHAAMGHCTPKKPAASTTKPKESGATKPSDKALQPSDPDCPPEHAAMGHCTPKKPSPSTGKPEESGATKPLDKSSQPIDPDCSPEHAAMGHCTPKKPASESKANVPATGTNLPAGNAPAPEAPEANYADRVWGKEAMAPVRADMYNEHGGMISSMFLLDLAAARFRDGEDGYQWDAEGWLGGDLNRIVIKSEGESYGDEGVKGAEVQAVYSRAIGPYFDFQAGLRHDFRPEPSKTYLALGFEGLAPYWNKIEATLFISDEGDVLGRLKGRYDQLITQRFVLETVGEINLSAQDIEDEDIGSGLVDGKLSLRLRYEIEREIAPYLGVSWNKTFGETARFARASGESTDESSLLVGLRLWM